MIFLFFEISFLSIIPSSHELMGKVRNGNDGPTNQAPIEWSMMPAAAVLTVSDGRLQTAARRRRFLMQRAGWLPLLHGQIRRVRLGLSIVFCPVRPISARMQFLLHSSRRSHSSNQQWPPTPQMASRLHLVMPSSVAV